MPWTPKPYVVGQSLIYLLKSAADHGISYSLAGQLQLSQMGWITLTVPASLIRGAFDALAETGIELPPFYAIPVISPTEIESIGGASKVSERGHSFKYTTGTVRTFEPNSVGISKTWYIQIYSLELKRLRQSYGLTPYLKGNPAFHLPIAVRKTNVHAENSITKISEEIYTASPDWNEFDMEAVKMAASGYYQEV